MRLHFPMMLTFLLGEELSLISPKIINLIVDQPYFSRREGPLGKWLHKWFSVVHSN